MKIVFCGPPHSGKSVFISNLRNKMPTNGHCIVRACPDGEGNWSNNEDQNVTTLVRNKGKFTNSFIQNVCDVIDNQKNKIVIVDVGGIISKENEEIFKHCDSFVVLSSDEEKKREWLEFGESLGLKCIGLLDSRLDGKDEIYSKEPYLHGKVTGLHRGENINSKLIDNLASTIIVKSEYNENEQIFQSNKKDEIVIDDTEIGFELGCGKEDYADIKDENGNVIESKKVKKVCWKEDILPDLNNLIMNKITKEKNVKLFGVRANFVFSTICCSCRKKGVDKITTYDARTDKYYEIKKLSQREGITEVPGLKYNIIENNDNIFMDVSVDGEKYTEVQYEKCILPKLAKDKDLYLSGRLPLWITGAIVSSYDVNHIYTFQPGKGFTCVNSIDERDLGKVKEKIPGIDITEYFDNSSSQNKMIESLKNSVNVSSVPTITEGNKKDNPNNEIEI